MKLGYKFYRNSFIKIAILSVACLGIFWEHLRGKGNPQDETGALILIAVIMVVGNAGLFIAMRRAKRREQAETAQARISDETPAPNTLQTDQKPKQSVMDKQVTERGIGVFALVGCGVLSYLSIISPLLLEKPKRSLTARSQRLRRTRPRLSRVFGCDESPVSSPEHRMERQRCFSRAAS